jgi:4-hydroxybenzoate polyprenyltransferase
MLPFRFYVWWHHIIPPILGLAFVLIDTRTERIDIIAVFQFLITLIGTAAFGYFINDWADIETDKRGGKANTVARIIKWKRYIILVSLLLGAFLPWFWLIQLPFGFLGFIFWLFELTVLTLYSVPPFRLKNKAIWGIICDTLYGHVLPIGIAMAIFCGHLLPSTSKLVVGSCLLFFKGMRNIITHQIQDRVADRKSKTRTFVLSFGVVQSINLVNRFILPIEILAIFVLGILFYTNEPIWLQSFLIFLTWTVIAFDIPFYRYKFRYDRFWYFLNDYYEGWFPYLSFILVVFHNSIAFYWTFVWVFVFYMPLLKLIKEVQHATNEVQKLCSRIINKSKKLIQIFLSK